MAWTAPLTAVANVALTAAQWNASVRDNLNETAPGKATAAGQIFVGSGLNAIVARVSGENAYSGGGTDTTNSTTYTGLTGGAAFSMATGAKAIIFNNATWTHDVAGSRSAISHSVSGATTTAATDSWAIISDCMVANRACTSSLSVAWTSLTPGTNTFTQAFRVVSNSLTINPRRLVGIPF